MNTTHLQVEIESMNDWTIFHNSDEPDTDRAWDKGSRMIMNIMADAQYYGNPKRVRLLIDHEVVHQLRIQKFEEDED